MYFFVKFVFLRYWIHIYSIVRVQFKCPVGLASWVSVHVFGKLSFLVCVRGFLVKYCILVGVRGFMGRVLKFLFTVLKLTFFTGTLILNVK